MIRGRREHGVATIALDRPAARNAVSAHGWDRLAEVAADLAASDCAAVLLTSDVPGIFSAGADLEMLGELIADVPARAAFRDRVARAVAALAALPMPVIAAVDGGCYGAAVALTLACDIVIAGDAAVFAVTPAKLGIGYPTADIAALERRIGRGQAARMLFAAEPVTADESARIGLSDLRAASAIDAARELAGRVAANDADAVRLLKRALTTGDAKDAGFIGAFGSAGFATRLAAFRERRR